MPTEKKHTRQPHCPSCRKAITAGISHSSLPFCSPRCQQVDLHRWLHHAYVIPGEETTAPTPEDDHALIS